MAWEIEGTHFETRSCDMVGPCTALLALGADYDRCRGPRRSAALFSGRIGGPMQALGPHVSESLGVERTPIEVREEGLYHSVEGKAAFSSSHFVWAA